MIAYLAGWARKKDSLFASVAEAAGGGVRLPLIGLSLRGFPESGARARAALAVAKRQPKGALGRALKFALIWMQYNWARRYFAGHPGRVAMCWNGLTGSRRAFMEGARDAGAPRLYAELAPFPGRVTLDPEGVNAANSVPRDPQFFRDWAAGAPGRQGEGWRRLGANLTARASRRADVTQGGAEALADVGPFLFVPLQVPNDSQITLFAGWVRSVEGMLAALAEASENLPEGWHVRIKEHPSARASLADPLAAAVARAGGRLVVDNRTDTFEQVKASSGVITINSSVGLQAFFHDKPVIALGEAFFAIEGLVHVADSPGRLAALLRAPGGLGFDPALRAGFMSYLDQVYYPRVTEDAAGNLAIAPEDARARLAAATAGK
ncbi:capsular biosynthesis protein [Actibacterium sp. MT2.3-13A]|uniref:capsular polysaccharide export protein, LipB/KpsS family n=1 Tax=Actibacterium sp. MT2.3-13A TaxID=2828332 RepID=UPI001BA455B2|nr:capsular biosynthesis protein [Actibacterium sp. MT2.3-13A]